MKEERAVGFWNFFFETLVRVLVKGRRYVTAHVEFMHYAERLLPSR